MGFNLQDQIKQLKKCLPIDDSFDVVAREVKVLNKDGYLVFIDGFTKDEIMYYILNHIQTKDDNLQSLKSLINKNIAYIEVETEESFKNIATSVLSGMSVLLIDGEKEAILLDTREYPVRSVGESETEKVSQGAKDCFVETIVFNTALIRRRIRTKDLIFEMKQIGNVSKTDVCISYMEDRVDKKVLAEIKNRLNKINVDDLLGAGNYIDELIFNKKWYNPLPQVKYTERPDVVASYLMEGHIAIIIDTSPAVIILPVTMMYFTQYVDDYNKSMIVGTITRTMRFFAILIALYAIPVWLLLAENNDIFNGVFSFIGVKEAVNTPLFVQFLILEAGFLLLQLSSLHTPNYLGGTFGIIGGLIVGDVAVKVGIFSIEPVFYMALTAIATYSIPNVEFANAIRIFRLFLLISTGLFGLVGLAVSVLIIFIITYKTETIKGANKYLWPLLPFDWKHLKYILFRIR